MVALNFSLIADGYGVVEGSFHSLDDERFISVFRGDSYLHPTSTELIVP